MIVQGEALAVSGNVQEQLSDVQIDDTQLQEINENLLQIGERISDLSPK